MINTLAILCVSICRKLTKVLKNYVDNADKLTEQLLKAMKALEYIFKFIVRSRVLFNQYVWYFFFFLQSVTLHHNACSFVIKLL